MSKQNESIESNDEQIIETVPTKTPSAKRSSVSRSGKGHLGLKQAAGSRFFSSGATDRVVVISSGASSAEKMLQSLLNDAMPNFSTGQLLLTSAHSPESLLNDLNVSFDEVLSYKAMVNALQRWSHTFADSGLRLMGEGATLSSGAKKTARTFSLPLLSPEVLISLVLGVDQDSRHEFSKSFRKVISMFASILAQSNDVHLNKIIEFVPEALSNDDIVTELAALTGPFNAGRTGAPLEPSSIMAGIATVFTLNLSEILAANNCYDAVGVVPTSFFNDIKEKGSFHILNTENVSAYQVGSRSVTETIALEFNNAFAKNEIIPLIQQIQRMERIRSTMKNFVTTGFAFVRNSFDKHASLIRSFRSLHEGVSALTDENAAGAYLSNFIVEEDFAGSLAGILYTVSTSGRTFTESSLEKSAALMDNASIKESWNKTPFAQYVTMVSSPGLEVRSDVQAITQGHEFNMQITSPAAMFNFDDVAGVTISSEGESHLINQHDGDRSDNLALLFYNLLAYKMLCSKEIRSEIRRGQQTAISGPWTFSLNTKAKVGNQLSSVQTAVTYDLGARLLASRLAVLYRALLVRDGYEASIRLDKLDAFATTIMDSPESINDCYTSVLDAIRSFANAAGLSALMDASISSSDPTAIPFVPISVSVDANTRRLLGIEDSYPKAIKSMFNLLSKKATKSRLTQLMHNSTFLYCREPGRSEEIAESSDLFELRPDYFTHANAAMLNSVTLSMKKGVIDMLPKKSETTVLRDYVNKNAYMSDDTLHISLMLPIGDFVSSRTLVGASGSFSNAVISGNGASKPVASMLVNKIKFSRLQMQSSRNYDERFTARRFADTITKFGSGIMVLFKICPDVNELYDYGMMPDDIVVNSALNSSDVNSILPEYGMSAEERVTYAGAAMIISVVPALTNRPAFPFTLKPNAAQLLSAAGAKSMIMLGDLLQVKANYAMGTGAMRSHILHVRTQEMIDFLFSDVVITTGAVPYSVAIVSDMYGIRVPDDSLLHMFGTWTFDNIYSTQISGDVALGVCDTILRDCVSFLGEEADVA